MNTSVRTRLNLLAATLIGIGLLVGALYPLESNSVRCGTAFFDRTQITDELDRLAGGYGIVPTGHDCDGVRSMWRTIWLVAAGGGVVLLAAGWVSGGQRREAG